MREYELLIDGKLVPPASGATLVTSNPANAEPVSLVGRGAARDARRALDAARRATAQWSVTAPGIRHRLLTAVADSLYERQAELADVETAESGIPIRISSILVATAVDRFRAAVERIDDDARPFGVVAVVPAPDAPLWRALELLGPAAGAGNCIVLKAPASSPGSTLDLARAVWEADLPPGVVNIVTGGADVDEELASNPLADRAVFAGDTPSARRFAEIVAPSLRPAAVDAGTSSTAIVLPDADLDLAVPGVLFGAMFLSGRTLRPLSRVLVHASILEPFVHHLVRGATSLRTGDPASFSIDAGPLASERAAETAQRRVELAVTEGAEIACGGRRTAAGGAFFSPTVLSKVANTMRIAGENLEAPVLSVMTFASTDEAVSIAEESTGDAAVWSRDADGAARAARALRAARVSINDYDPLDSSRVAVTRPTMRPVPNVARARQALIGLDAVYGFEANPFD